MKLIAAKDFYTHKRGDALERGEVYAKVLVAVGLATYDDEQTEAPSEPVPLPSVRKRTYKRRDMRAE